MATLTNIDGYQIAFDPSKICVIADHDADSGQAVTCVYGILKARVETAETVDALLNRLGIASNFVRLTRPSGYFVMICGAAVSVVRPPLPDEYVPEVNAVILVGSITQGVTENVANATAAINAHGGRI